MLSKYNVLQRAEKYVIQRKFAQAIREYEKLLEQDPDEPTLLNTVGDLLLRQGEVAQAQAYFHRVAELYLQSGFLVKAIAMYKKLHQIQPDDLEVNEVLAELYQKQGWGFESERHLEFLIAHYENQNQLSQALHYLERLVTVRPRDPERHLRVARFQQSRGQHREPVEAYLMAADCYLDEDLHQQAFECLREGLQAFPNEGLLLRRLVEVAIASESTDSAEKYLRRRLETAPSKYPCQMYLAWLLEQGGETQQARELYQELKTAGVADAIVLDGIARTTPKKVETDPDYFKVSRSSADEMSSPELSFQTLPGDDYGLSSEKEGSGFFDVEDVAEPIDPTLPGDQFGGDDLRPELTIGQSESALEDTSEPPSPLSLDESLQEVDFYLKLGFQEEALKLMERLLRDSAEDPRVLERAQKMKLTPPPRPAQKKAEAEEEVPPTEFESSIEDVLQSLFEDPELGVADSSSSEEVLRYDIGSGDQATSADSPQLHYDLGLAYKEMSLLQDAVQEFETALNMWPEESHAQRTLCYSMLANSCLLMGEFGQAARWARAGLAAPGNKDFEWKALEYDLSRALEETGDLQEAKEHYEKIFEKDPAYRDVKDRIDQLQLQLNG